MRISDTEFRAYVAAATVGIITAKGAADAEAVARAAIKVAQELRRQLLSVKEEGDDYGKSRTGSDSDSA